MSARAVQRSGVVRASGNVAALLALAVAVAALHARRVALLPATLCPLRALTGLPCPACGGTTAAAAMGRLDPGAALRANPVVVLGAGFLAVAPATRVRAWWAARPSRVRRSALAGALLLAETWQLLRFGVLPS